jgi:hypothetical protein
MQIVGPSHTPPTHRHSSLSLRHTRSTNRAAPYSSQPGRSSRASLLRDDANNSSRVSFSSAVSSAFSGANSSIDVPGPQAVSLPPAAEVVSSTRQATRYLRPLVGNLTELLEAAPGWHALVCEAITLYLTETFVNDSVWDREEVTMNSAGECLNTIYGLNQTYRSLPDTPTKAICLPLDPCECFLNISTNIRL